jgi:hypothetical protein
MGNGTSFLKIPENEKRPLPYGGGLFFVQRYGECGNYKIVIVQFNLVKWSNNDEDKEEQRAVCSGKDIFKGASS